LTVYKHAIRLEHRAMIMAITPDSQEKGEQRALLSSSKCPMIALLSILPFILHSNSNS
jgi:hypothetical protein